jgi:hypothetical protein
MFWLVRDTKLVIYVAGGIGATLAILYGAGWLMVRAAGRLVRRELSRPEPIPGS